MVDGWPLPQGDGDPGPAATAGPCVFCGAHCCEDDYCHGCKNIVCPDCDMKPRMSDVVGPHRPSVHGALRRREINREVERGRFALREGRLLEAEGALNSIAALLRA